MQNLLRIIAISFLIAAVLWGCTPLAATLNPALHNTVAVVLPAASTSVPGTPALEVTEFSDYSPAIPERSRAGSCEVHSNRIPRTNVWQCRVEDQNYDPCFTIGAEEVIVCSEDPFDPASLFRVDLTAPLHVHESPTPDQSLNLDDLQSLWYFGIDVVDGAVGLTDGQYHFSSALPQTSAVSQTNASSQITDTANLQIVVRLSEQGAVGDLDMDGDEDAVAVLIATASDIFSRYYLATLSNEAGVAVNSATIAFGDGIRVDNLAIENGQIVVDMTSHGAQDPLCCPTHAETRYYNLVGNQLELYVNGWQLELSDGTLCSLPSKGNDIRGYQCNDGRPLVGSLQPGLLWTAQRASKDATAQSDATNLETVTIRKIWR